jgi:hypothetical protein
MSNEKGFMRLVITNLRAAGINVYRTEIPTAPGFPDLLVCKNDRAIFIELKDCMLEPFSALGDKLTKYQAPWAKNHRAHGNSPVYVLARVKSRIGGPRKFILLTMQTALNKCGMDRYGKYSYDTIREVVDIIKAMVGME